MSPLADLLEGGSEEDASESGNDDEQDATDDGVPDMDMDMAGEDDMRQALDFEVLSQAGTECHKNCGLAVLC